MDSGEVRIFCDRVGDQPLTHANYPVVAADGSVYCSVSTRAEDYVLSTVEGRDDGFIVRVTEDGHAELAADDLKFPNCMTFDAAEEFLYCVQTSSGDVVRLPVHADGSLGKSELYGPPLGDRDVYGEDAIRAVWGDQESRTVETADPSVFYGWAGVDGCAFDAEGNLWVTRASRGDLVAITPDGGLVDIACEGESLLMPTSVAFGGEDNCDVYIGTLFLPYVLKGRSSVPGPRR
jgi:gluconolactonase